MCWIIGTSLQLILVVGGWSLASLMALFLLCELLNSFPLMLYCALILDYEHIVSKLVIDGPLSGLVGCLVRIYQGPYHLELETLVTCNLCKFSLFHSISLLVVYLFISQSGSTLCSN